MRLSHQERVYNVLCVCVKLLSHVQLFAILWTIACQAPLSMAFFRQEYWNCLPFPTLGDLPNPGLKPASPTSPALAGGFFTAEPPGKPGPLNVKVRLP